MKQLPRDFLARAETAPDAVAVVDATGEHTVAEVAQAATALASALGAALDGAPTVLVRADNTWRTLAASIAVGLREGMIAVISGHATAAEYGLALEDLQPDAIVAPAETIVQWRVDDSKLPKSADVLDGWHLHACANGRAQGTERWAGGVAVAMTSGSTGRPKCVVQSEGALRYAGQSTIDAVGLQPGDPVGALVPLSSVAALCFGMHLPAMLGSPMVCLAKWRPADAIELLRKTRVAWTMLVPTMALQLSQVPGSEGALNAMKAMTVGGGPMTMPAMQAAEEHLGTKFLRVFGMSECMGHTTPRPDDSAAIRLGRDGRPFPGTELRVVDKEDRPVETGQIGLAQVKGPSLFLGYARNGRPVPPDVTPDGFFPTGDRARLNADGTVSIVGREKAIIIRGGRNIDVNEVEADLGAIPGVVQVAIVALPDPMLGERVAALVVTPAGQMTLEDMQRELAAADVPKYKWPEYVHSVPALPQNRVGKLDQVAARALAAELSGVDLGTTEDVWSRPSTSGHHPWFPREGGSMYYNLVLLAAKPNDWTHEQFIEWWRGEHADVTYGLPGLRRWHHTEILEALDDRHSAGWDGVSVLSFDSKEALDAALASPEWQRAIEHVGDMRGRRIAVTGEEMVMVPDS